MTRRAASHYASVVFDCDSTLSAVEGIDELAGPRRAEVERLTHAAMLGEIPLEDVYGRRLALIRPSRSQIDALAAQYVAALVPDAHAVVSALRAEGIAVRIMSGGLLPAVTALAAHLGIPAHDVGAVDVMFDEGGAFSGFDEASPLARSRGKHALMTEWRRVLPTPIMLVGDGATDLEAATAADLFVAFAGIVERAAVTAAADVVIRARSLAPVAALALGDGKLHHAASAALVQRGRALLQRTDLPSPTTADQTLR